MKKYIIVLLIISSLVVIVRDGRSDRQARAPEFTLTDLDGNKVSLSNFKGKVVYLDIWASWCGPCIMEIKDAKKVKEHFQGNDNVVFLYISIDENTSKWKNMIKKNNINGVHLISKKGEEDDILQKYNVPSIPRFVLIDKQGNIADWNARTPSDYDNIVDDIERLLM